MEVGFCRSQPKRKKSPGRNPPTATAEVIDLNAPSPVWRYTAPMNNARRHLNATLLPDEVTAVISMTVPESAGSVVRISYVPSSFCVTVTAGVGISKCVNRRGPVTR